MIPLYFRAIADPRGSAAQPKIVGMPENGDIMTALWRE